jgi:cytochrome c biogenesis protein CcmG/thiol:disulfide interchange protein DsbE
MTTQVKQRRFPLIPVLIAIGAIALVTTIVLTFSGASEFGSPEISGEALPALPEQGADPALGMTIPTVDGENFSGDSVKIADDGRPKILLFLAHWCPHCQAEVPLVQGWVDDGGMPEGVDLIGVATAITSTRENYPPSDWLKTEGWSSPLVVDDEDSTVATSFGLSAFPFWVFVGPDGSVVGRTTGEIPLDGLIQIADGLATVEVG